MGNDCNESAKSNMSGIADEMTRRGIFDFGFLFFDFTPGST